MGHAETKILFTDKEFSATIKEALDLLSEKPIVIDIDDPNFQEGELLGESSYDDFIKEGDKDYRCFQVSDEWQAISFKLYVWNNRGSKGSSLSSSWRVLECII